MIYAILEQVDELLKQRDSIHSCFTVTRTVATTGGGGHFSNGSSSKLPVEDDKFDSPGEGGSDSKDKYSKKKWFGLMKGLDRK